MGLEVKVLDLGDIELDTSFLVLALEPGQAQQVPTLGFLITGGEAPIVVDTGFSDPSIMGNLGMTAGGATSRAWRSSSPSTASR